MTRVNVLATVLYHMSVDLKNQNFNKLLWKHNRDKLLSSLSAMQFLTACIGLRDISFSRAEQIITTLNITYKYNTDNFSDLLKEASEKSNYSAEYDDILSQMHWILSDCIDSVVKMRKGYILTVANYIKAFHNYPRAFLPLNDKLKISPLDAIEYSKSYLKLD